MRLTQPMAKGQKPRGKKSSVSPCLPLLLFASFAAGFSPAGARLLASSHGNSMFATACRHSCGAALTDSNAISNGND